VDGPDAAKDLKLSRRSDQKTWWLRSGNGVVRWAARASASLRRMRQLARLLNARFEENGTCGSVRVAGVEDTTATELSRLLLASKRPYAAISSKRPAEPRRSLAVRSTDGAAITEDGSRAGLRGLDGEEQ